MATATFTSDCILLGGGVLYGLMRFDEDVPPALSAVLALKKPSQICVSRPSHHYLLTGRFKKKYAEKIHLRT